MLLFVTSVELSFHSAAVWKASRIINMTALCVKLLTQMS